MTTVLRRRFRLALLPLLLIGLAVTAVSAPKAHASGSYHVDVDYAAVKAPNTAASEYFVGVSTGPDFPNARVSIVFECEQYPSGPMHIDGWITVGNSPSDPDYLVAEFAASSHEFFVGPILAPAPPPQSASAFITEGHYQGQAVAAFSSGSIGLNGDSCPAPTAALSGRLSLDFTTY